MISSLKNLFDEKQQRKQTQTQVYFDSVLSILDYILESIR